MNNIFKFVQGLEGFNILLKGVIKTIKNELEEEEGGFTGILLGTLEVLCLLGNMLTRKGMITAGYGKRMLRAGYGKKIDF